MRKSKLICIIVIICLFFLPSITHAQEWTAPAPYRCYGKIKVSVINYGKIGDKYSWGVKFINNYEIPVRFKYKMSIGEKITSKSNWMATNMIGTDQSDSHSSSKIQGISYDSPSEEWFVYIWDVCFEGMRCGGADECFASCDNNPNNPKPNQPCGLSATALENAAEIDNTPKEMSGRASSTTKKEENVYSGEYTEWVQEGKDDMVFTIGITDGAVYWKKKNGEPVAVFKPGKYGLYGYDMGENNEMTIKFESENRLMLSKNGSLIGYFRRPGTGKQEISEKPAINKPEERTIIIKNGLWKLNCAGTEHKANIKMVNGEILFTDVELLKFPPFVFIKKGVNEYGFEGRTDFKIVVKDPETFTRTINGISCSDYKFIGEAEEKPGFSATKLNGKWKSSVKYIKRSSLTAINDDEFDWDWKVSVMGMGNKGQTHFKRQSENVFVAVKTKAKEQWCRMMITWISDNKLQVQQFDCDGNLTQTDTLTRVIDKDDEKDDDKDN